MLPPARIIVGVDFSPDSKKAFCYASHFARILGAALDVVHVIHPSLIAAAGDRADGVVPDVHEALSSLTASLSPTPLDVRHHVVIGLAGDALMHVAERENADLVVTGSRGMTLAERVAFGSTTERLLRLCNIPVLIVPASTTATPGTRGVGPIVVGLECTESAADAVRAAGHMASALGTDLRIVHAVPHIETTPWLARLTSRALRTQADRARKELNVLLEGLSIDPERLDVRAGEVAQVLGDAIVNEPDALVVLGRCCGASGHPGGGSIARRILMLGSTPVLVHVASE